MKAERKLEALPQNIAELELDAIRRIKVIDAPPDPDQKKWIIQQLIAVLAAIIEPVELVRQVGPGERPEPRYVWDKNEHLIHRIF